MATCSAVRSPDVHVKDLFCCATFCQPASRPLTPGRPSGEEGSQPERDFSYIHGGRLHCLPPGPTATLGLQYLLGDRVTYDVRV